MTEGGTRRVPARIGIVALNLIMPGLGLLRVQQGRAAALFLVAQWIVFALIIIAFLLLPTLSFASWAALMGLAVIAVVAAYVGAMLLSWRRSASVPRAAPGWSRWYGMAGIVLVLWALTGAAPELLQPAYRTFYTPAEAMMPTLAEE